MDESLFDGNLFKNIINIKEPIGISHKDSDLHGLYLAFLKCQAFLEWLKIHNLKDSNKRQYQLSEKNTFGYSKDIIYNDSGQSTSDKKLRKRHMKETMKNHLLSLRKAGYLITNTYLTQNSPMTKDNEKKLEKMFGDIALTDDIYSIHKQKLAVNNCLVFLQAHHGDLWEEFNKHITKEPDIKEEADLETTHKIEKFFATSHKTGGLLRAIALLFKGEISFESAKLIDTATTGKLTDPQLFRHVLNSCGMIEEIKTILNEKKLKITISDGEKSFLNVSGDSCRPLERTFVRTHNKQKDFIGHLFREPLNDKTLKFIKIQYEKLDLITETMYTVRTDTDKEIVERAITNFTFLVMKPLYFFYKYGDIHGPSKMECLHVPRRYRFLSNLKRLVRSAKNSVRYSKGILESPELNDQREKIDGNIDEEIDAEFKPISEIKDDSDVIEYDKKVNVNLMKDVEKLKIIFDEIWAAYGSVLPESIKASCDYSYSNYSLASQKMDAMDWWASGAYSLLHGKVISKATDDPVYDYIMLTRLLHSVCSVAVIYGSTVGLEQIWAVNEIPLGAKLISAVVSAVAVRSKAFDVASRMIETDELKQTKADLFSKEKQLELPNLRDSEKAKLIQDVKNLKLKVTDLEKTRGWFQKITELTDPINSRFRHIVLQRALYHCVSISSLLMLIPSESAALAARTISFTSLVAFGVDYITEFGSRLLLGVFENFNMTKPYALYFKEAIDIGSGRSDGKHTTGKAFARIFMKWVSIWGLNVVTVKMYSATMDENKVNELQTTLAESSNFMDPMTAVILQTFFPGLISTESGLTTHHLWYPIMQFIQFIECPLGCREWTGELFSKYKGYSDFLNDGGMWSDILLKFGLPAIVFSIWLFYTYMGLRPLMTIIGPILEAGGLGAKPGYQKGSGEVLIKPQIAPFEWPKGYTELSETHLSSIAETKQKMVSDMYKYLSDKYVGCKGFGCDWVSPYGISGFGAWSAETLGPHMDSLSKEFNEKISPYLQDFAKNKNFTDMIMINSLGSGNENFVNSVLAGNTTKEEAGNMVYQTYNLFASGANISLAEVHWMNYILKYAQSNLDPNSATYAIDMQMYSDAISETAQVGFNMNKTYDRIGSEKFLASFVRKCTETYEILTTTNATFEKLERFWENATGVYYWFYNQSWRFLFYGFIWATFTSGIRSAAFSVIVGMGMGWAMTFVIGTMIPLLTFVGSKTGINAIVKVMEIFNQRTRFDEAVNLRVNQIMAQTQNQIGFIPWGLAPQIPVQPPQPPVQPQPQQGREYWNRFLNTLRRIPYATNIIGAQTNGIEGEEEEKISFKELTESEMEEVLYLFKFSEFVKLHDVFNELIYPQAFY